MAAASTLGDRIRQVTNSVYIYIPIGSVQSLACKLRIQAFTTSYKATVEQMGRREQGAEGGSYYVVTM